MTAEWNETLVSFHVWHFRILEAKYFCAKI